MTRPDMLINDDSCSLRDRSREPLIEEIPHQIDLIMRTGTQPTAMDYTPLRGSETKSGPPSSCNLRSKSHSKPRRQGLD